MEVRVLLEELSKANLDADVTLPTVVERDPEGEWSQKRQLRTVWVFENTTVCLDESEALQGDDV